MLFLATPSCTDLKVVTDVIDTVLTLIQIAVPLLIVLFGSIDFAKAVMSSDEKAIKTAQKTLLNRVIAGVVVFLMATIVNVLFGMFTDGSVCGEVDCSLPGNATNAACTN